MRAKEIIFVVDDEESLREYLSILLAKEGYVVRTFANGEEVLSALEELNPAVVLLDLKMPDMNGLEVLKKIKILSPESQVIIMTAYGTIKSAVEAMHLGAFHYLTKPFDVNELKIEISKAIEFRRLREENINLRRQLKISFNEIIGKAPNFVKVLELVERVAPTDATVLIQGESGTGKELIARAIHENSLRSGYRFVAINCAALPEDLLESELFGYVKGAFTGANTDKDGLLKVAHRGTIFLDEIAEISPKIQVKLLRALQEREFVPLGSTRPVKVDVRIIASTNKNLEKLVKEGKFREDLFYRLNVITINLPPLRERKEDIPLLVNYFVKKFSQKHGLPVKKVPKKIMDLLMEYNWPGNVRELENAIERAIILSPEDTITEDSLPSQIISRKSSGAEIPPPVFTLEELEKRYILKVLESVNWDKARAAKILGINVSTVYRKLERYGIRVEAEFPRLASK